MGFYQQPAKDTYSALLDRGESLSQIVGRILHFSGKLKSYPVIMSFFHYFLGFFFMYLLINCEFPGAGTMTSVWSFCSFMMPDEGKASINGSC